MENIVFMNCIHPELFGMKAANFRDHVTDLLPSFWRALRRRLR
jgi:hypothetical protein